MYCIIIAAWTFVVTTTRVYGIVRVMFVIIINVCDAVHYSV